MTIDNVEEINQEKINNNNCVNISEDTSNENTILQVMVYTNNFQDILKKEDAVKLGIFKDSGNGSGNRQPLCKLFYTTYIYGEKNRNCKTYPSCYKPELSSFLETIDKFKQNCNNKRGIVGFIIHQLNLDKEQSRPIRGDIKKHYLKLSCVICGSSSNLVCDHKNDLYNDPRVLDTKTQTLDDFQSLCNSCNLRKRAISILTINENKRFGATRLKQFEVFGIDFIQGDESFDKNDINAMVGTYWYDPVYFMKQLKQKMLFSQEIIINDNKNLIEKLTAENEQLTKILKERPNIIQKENDTFQENKCII